LADVQVVGKLEGDVLGAVKDGRQFW
jgi:hypothetical protein